jgi:hypothetical protein
MYFPCRILFLLILFIVFAEGAAQQLIGLQFSNFNGVHTIYTNPAGLADARFKKHSNVFTTAVMFANDYAKLEMPFSFKQWIFGNVPNEYKNAEGNIDWQTRWIKENINGKPKNLFLGLENRGPAYMNRLGKNGAFAIATRTRSTFQLNQVAEPLIQYGKSLLDSQSVKLSTLTDNRFTLNMNAYQELSFSLARVVYNKKMHYLKIGGSAKYLIGLGSGYIVNNGIEFNAMGGDSVIIQKSDISVGYTGGTVLERFSRGIYRWALPSVSEITGGGLGWDAGFIYEYRPDKMDKITSANRYLYKLSVSLIDMGAITYGKNVNTFRIRNQAPVKIHVDSGFTDAFAHNLDSGIRFSQSFAQKNLQYEEGSGKITSSIPSSVVMQLDWNVLKWFYLGINWNQAVISRRKIALRQPSSLIIIPRIENKIVEFSVPLSLYNDYKNVGVGLFTRVGPVFLGTDNLIKSVTGNSYSGLDFYLGISTGLGSKKRKKQD